MVGGVASVARSLGQQLMQRLRLRSASPADSRVDDLPAMPTQEQLTQAAAAARSGRAADCEQYALLLLSVDADPTAGEVRQAGEELLVAADASMWRDLDRVVRRSWWRAPAWSDSARGRVSSGQAGLLGLVVASFHPSGYVREAAVGRRGEIEGPLSARALTVRSSDWVPEVRNRARAGITQHLSSTDGLLAVGALAEAFGTRVHGRWLAEQFETAVARLGDDDLALLRAASDWRLRRAAYRVALTERRLDLRQLLDATQHDADLVIRTRCADAAIHAAATMGDLSPVRPLTDSGTATVRASAVAALARAGDNTAALTALRDRNPVVREVAQAVVRRAGTDPATRYRDLVRMSEPPDPGALAGLGETGNSADAELIRPALTHPLPRCRAAAVRALRRLGAADIDTMVAMLADDVPAVARQAAQALRARASNVALASLEPLVEPTAAPHTRTAAYRVLREHDAWTRLRLDLQLYDDGDENLRNRARADITAWLNREAATTYSMPPADAACLLESLITYHADALGPKQQRLLRFHLGLTNRNHNADP